MPVELLTPLIAAASAVRSLVLVIAADTLAEAAPDKVKLMVPLAATPLKVAALVATALTPIAFEAVLIFVATCLALSPAAMAIATVEPPLVVVNVEVDALLTVLVRALFVVAATKAPRPVPSITNLWLPSADAWESSMPLKTIESAAK